MWELQFLAPARPGAEVLEESNEFQLLGREMAACHKGPPGATSYLKVPSPPGKAVTYANSLVPPTALSLWELRGPQEAASPAAASPAPGPDGGSDPRRRRHSHSHSEPRRAISVARHLLQALLCCNLLPELSPMRGGGGHEGAGRSPHPFPAQLLQHGAPQLEIASSDRKKDRRAVF